MKTFQIKDDDISDGYHTFRELYNHRKLLYINLCLLDRHKCIWADHKDWDSILLMWNSPHGQISYHISYDMKPLIEGRIKEVKFGDHNWDGHSSEDVLDRLHNNAAPF